MNWNQIVEKISPYVVKIQTPSGSGTGFLLTYNENRQWCCVATAWHVISHEEEWKEPIKIYHHTTAKEVFLRDGDRVIFSDWETDSAVILFANGSLPLPECPLPLFPRDQSISIGCEVGWVGFPAIELWTMCFFCGNISARRQDKKAYLIDGVAINGVSGGPVLYSTDTDGVQVVGIMTAYRANRTGGSALPGLSFAQDLSHLHATVQTIKSIDEARKKKQEQEAQQPNSDQEQPKES